MYWYPVTLREMEKRLAAETIQYYQRRKHHHVMVVVAPWEIGELAEGKNHGNFYRMRCIRCKKETVMLFKDRSRNT